MVATELYRFYHSGNTEVVALRGVSLSLKRGELVVLLGPSGSGKSTLLNLIAGLDHPDGGSIDIAGHRLSRRSERVRAGLRARVHRRADAIGEPRRSPDACRQSSFTAVLAGKEVDDSAAMELAGRLSLSALWNARPFELSGGEAARAGLAIALSAEPLILLCDEPTGEVDADTEQQLVEELAGRRSEGMSVLVATHSAALARVADRVLRLRDGKLVDE